MLTYPKEKLVDLKQNTHELVAYGAMLVERIVNKEVLLRHSNFRLIHVPDDEGGWRMPLKIVIPAVDRSTRHKVRKQGYFTVSHVWGPKEKWESWTSHGVIGTDRKIVEVDIRPEKQNTLLDLLRSTPGYWWIDVFCAHPGDPLSIMGPVYRFCHRCYALVDFPSDGFRPIELIGARLKSLKLVDHLAEIYNKRVNGKMGYADVTWDESLNDLLAGWQDGDSAHIKNLANFFDCEWFRRVWTLQEYILPHDLTFISEAGPVHVQLDRIVLIPIIHTLCKIAAKSQGLNSAPLTSVRSECHYICPFSNRDKPTRITVDVSRSYFDLARFDAFCLYDLYNKRGDMQQTHMMPFQFFSSKDDFLIPVLTKIATFPRKCMYPQDYIYGVCGLLDMDIPAGLEKQMVWHSFRNIVKKRAPSVNLSKISPLADATNMQDVYNAFIAANIPNMRATIDVYHGPI